MIITKKVDVSEAHFVLDEYSAMEVTVDIKPGSEENTIDLPVKGVVR